MGGIPLAAPQEVVGAEHAKGAKKSSLESNAGDDDVVARVEELGRVAARRSGQSTTDSLQDQTRDVGRDEDERVEPRLDAGDLRVDRQDNMLEREIDGDADEGRAEDDGADLRLECLLVERVVVKLRSGNVACTGKRQR